MESDFLQTSIYGFSTLLKQIVWELRHSAIVNIFCGNLYTLIKPHLDVFLQFPQCGAVKDYFPDHPITSAAYKLHGKHMEVVRPPIDPNLERPVRIAFGRF
ncbi:hypothetical protein ONZ43_g1111 [Nemania bipapillata]|uniref:Uncharacterized protein n=1 Tax=Nemania bipapillata TaxID=110536 RepID=A0ACC2J5K5_9PEZI|nr:hypothetical protein ONZ43_g1111 [Nemania bipapillata]